MSCTMQTLWMDISKRREDMNFSFKSLVEMVLFFRNEAREGENFV